MSETNQFDSIEPIQYGSEPTNEYPILNVDTLPTNSDAFEQTIVFSSEPSLIVDEPPVPQNIPLYDEPEIYHEGSQWIAEEVDYGDYYPEDNYSSGPSFDLIDEKPSKLSGMDKSAKLGAMAVIGCLLIGAFLIGFVLVSTGEIREDRELNGSGLDNNGSLETENVFGDDTPFATSDTNFNSVRPSFTSTTRSNNNSSTSSNKSTTSRQRQTTTTKDSNTSLSVSTPTSVVDTPTTKDTKPPTSETSTETTPEGPTITRPSVTKEP